MVIIYLIMIILETYEEIIKLIPKCITILKEMVTFTATNINEDTIVEQARAFTKTDLENLLKFLSDYYHNDQALVSDKTYDELIDLYEDRYGPYTVVGAEPRGERVNLPYYLSSLRKVKKSGELMLWIQQYPGPYLVEDKIDGLTLLYVRKTTNGKINHSLYTRGAGVRGIDVSHLLPYLRLPTLPRDMAIRGEVVMTKEAFARVGKAYKNARNLTSGIVNAKKQFDPVLAGALSYYAYRIVSEVNTPEGDLTQLMGMGFLVPSPVSTPTVTHDMLDRYYVARKAIAPYEMDGLVVYQNKAIAYPAAEDPRHIVAFKLEEGDKATVVVTHVEWNPSKDNLLKPIVHYQTVNLGGADLSKATGYNARFIVQNKIGPGARVVIIRSGDVIPKIIAVETPAPAGPQLPDPAVQGQYNWNENQVEFVVVGTNKEITAKKMKHFVDTLDVKNMGPGRIKNLVEGGVDSIQKLITATPQRLAQIDGIGAGLAQQFHGDLQNKIKNIGLAKIMDASGVFPHIGERRFDMIVAAYPNFYDMLKWPTPQLSATIKQVKGFNQLADEIANSAAAFLAWMQQHPTITIAGTLPNPAAVAAIAPPIVMWQPPVVTPGKTVQLIVPPVVTPGKTLQFAVPPVITTTVTGRPPIVFPVAALPAPVAPAPVTPGRAVLLAQQVQAPPTYTNNLAGKTVVFSGFRDAGMEDAIKLRGGRVTTSVSGNTSFVVMKNVDDVKGKAQEALAKGIPLISREDFTTRYLQ